MKLSQLSRQLKRTHIAVLSSLILLSGMFSSEAAFASGATNDGTMTITVSNYTNYPVEFGFRNWGMPLKDGVTIGGIGVTNSAHSDIKIDSSTTLLADDSVSIPPITGPSNPGVLTLTANVEFSDFDNQVDASAGYTPSQTGTVACYNSGQNYDKPYPVFSDFSNDCALEGYSELQSGYNSDHPLADSTHEAPRFDLVFASGGSLVTFIYSTSSIENDDHNSGELLFAQRHNTLMSPDGQKTLVVCLTSASGGHAGTNSTNDALGIQSVNSSDGLLTLNTMGAYAKGGGTLWDTLNFTINTADQNACTNSDQIFSITPQTPNGDYAPYDITPDFFPVQ